MIRTNACRIWCSKLYRDLLFQTELFGKLMDKFLKEILEAKYDNKISIHEELWWPNESIVWAWINLFKFHTNELKLDNICVLKIALKSRQIEIKIVAVDVLLKILKKSKILQVKFYIFSHVRFS